MLRLEVRVRGWGLLVFSDLVRSMGFRLSLRLFFFMRLGEEVFLYLVVFSLDSFWLFLWIRLGIDREIFLLGRVSFLFFIFMEVFGFEAFVGIGWVVGGEFWGCLWDSFVLYFRLFRIGCDEMSMF